MNTNDFTEVFRRIGLPGLPSAVVRAVARARDPGCSIRDITHLVGQDAGLLATLLKLINDYHFGGATRIGSVTMAVVELGLPETINFALAAGLARAWPGVSGGLAQHHQAIWQHSMRTAALARSVARHLGLRLGGAEFVAGLFHDLGRFLVPVGFPKHFATLAVAKVTSEKDLVNLEQGIMGFDHAELGAWAARVWDFPDELVVSIRYHHSPASATPPSPLASLVCLVDEMAAWVEAGRSLRECNLAGNSAWSLLSSGQQGWDPRSLADAVMQDWSGRAESLGRMTVGTEKVRA